MDETPPNDVDPGGFTTNEATAYYNVPPIWIGEDPFEKNSFPPEEVFHEEVISHICAGGIKVIACRDGLFIFDFMKWAPGAPTTIPAFKREPGKKVPEHVTKAHDEVAQRIYRRVEVMNAHVACLNTSIAVCEKTNMPIGHGINASDYLVAVRTSAGEWGFQLNPQWHPMHAYFAMHWNVSGFIQRDRRCFEVSTVRHSFDLLDQLLTSQLPDSMMIAALFLRSASSYREHDFSGSLIASWTVLEKLVSILWTKLVDKHRHRGNPPEDIIFINKERKGKLLKEGGDYSASIRIEILSLMGEIDLQMYNDLNTIRRSRNDWMHKLEAADAKGATLAIRTAQRLFEQLTEIHFNLSLSYSLSY